MTRQSREAAQATREVVFLLLLALAVLGLGKAFGVIGRRPAPRVEGGAWVR